MESFIESFIRRPVALDPLGLIGKQVPVRTMNSILGSVFFLGRGGDIVGTKRGAAAEESLGDDDELVFRLCMRVETIIAGN